MVFFSLDVGVGRKVLFVFDLSFAGGGEIGGVRVFPSIFKLG